MQTNPRDITQTNEMISLIDDAIADSLGPDWTSFDAAHHVMQWLQDAGLQIVPAAFAEREARLVGALEQIATVDMGGGFLGAQACRKVALAALKDRTHG